MMFKPVTAAAVLLAVSATHATAQDAPDYYVTGALGASIAEDWVARLQSALRITTSGAFETSPLIRLGVGYDFDAPLRAEVELARRALDFSDTFYSQISGRTLDTDSASDVEVTTLMINGVYDFDLPTSDYGIYVGAGLGMAQVDVAWQRGPGAPGFVLSRGDYTASATQLRLGVDRAMANGMTIFADYTYLHIAESDYDGFNTAVGNVTQSFSAINTHELAIGLRYNF